MIINMIIDMIINIIIMKMKMIKKTSKTLLDYIRSKYVK